ncbi:MAG: RsmE family RNA methyltransferase, partial [Candidatus Omnitrophica bacterium]|nr:RsmE family RNA methyltransferase [Candidatus Omnitrophota bacterium]
MHRLYCSFECISGNKIIISDLGRIHHLANVLRMKKGDAVFVFDDLAGEYNCVIDRVTPKEICLLIQNKIDAIKAKTPVLSIACALPKKSKIDDIIDKLTQVGCDQVIPMSTERSIVRLNQTKALVKHKRWQKISQEASLQSQRKDIAQVSHLKNFFQVISEARPEQ